MNTNDYKPAHHYFQRAIDEGAGCPTHHDDADLHRWEQTTCCMCWQRATVEEAGEAYCQEHFAETFPQQ